ncbi:hypothetical protein [Bacillus paranthracis]|uniref:hypothetical protein n=1 Tax=Bacillus paranthracis TaxID=2026186 RepID=UPI0021589D8B|nr:hypothetical protein [Bacillus paranthracis]MCR6795671.1 hypothetical protein [Bacillus paranthracis]MED1166024.1 hypothetical protein [Bacillus paranthracis]
MGPKTAKLHLVTGETITLNGKIVQNMAKGFDNGNFIGISLITDPVSNITYNMANVTKIEWL